MTRPLLALFLSLLLLGCPGSPAPSEKGSAVLDTRGAACYDFSTPALFDCPDYPELADLELVGKCEGRPLMRGEWMHLGEGELAGVRSVPADADFSGSEDYSRMGHVYIVKTREGGYAKMKITGLVSLKEFTGTCDWQMTIDYVYQPGGLKRFSD